MLLQTSHPEIEAELLAHARILPPGRRTTIVVSSRRAA
jgi:hypothetical protein